MKHASCFIDIETIPSGIAVDPRSLTPPGNMKKSDTIEQWYQTEAPRIAEEQFRKRALDSMQGEILVVSWAVDNEDPQFLVQESDVDQAEEYLMTQLEFSLQNTVASPIIWIGHNAIDFDMLWLWRRAIRYDLPWLANNIKIDRYRGNIHDTMQIWSGGRSNGYCKLDAIASFLGLPGKTDDMDGSQVYDYYLQGRINEIADYCVQDVRLVRDVYKHISWGM